MNNIKNRAEEIVSNEIIYVYEDMKMVLLMDFYWLLDV